MEREIEPEGYVVSVDDRRIVVSGRPGLDKEGNLASTLFIELSFAEGRSPFVKAEYDSNKGLINVNGENRKEHFSNYKGKLDEMRYYLSEALETTQFSPLIRGHLEVIANCPDFSQ